ncbi:MAG: squalene--hopene cyclase [Prosthecobacter sp.]|jgi:squalene-hopene/tetraprenyl-beta-curcumene cyclase|uniref:prenyltransferase/squalene oxidase repeat-containing protein n=1 Tax=Prosthecobacter sp. TaxID=1965333 RepID=UPI001A0CEDC1|nr:prenyltransferase/squalene oxidase repeat-containing protein [Prosthecobacter sp.]MBE2282418.1 squalene--hopene cyclase [Prosthecobacter sp.]
MMDALDRAISSTQAHLDSLRTPNGHWEGHLSSSALSTATAIVALTLVDREKHAVLLQKGTQWLCDNQNTDGGWGDTTLSKSNLSTTLLCWSALHLGVRAPSSAIEKADSWIISHVGSLESKAIARAVIARYGKDKTFSVPILMLCTLCGTLGKDGWRHVIPLPFELAALPRTWFGAIGLPVVSYALPALIAIGHARFHHAPPAWWNPLRWIRALAWPRIRPMLQTLQPGSGGYLEATPLTSFVTMALAGANQLDHPCIPLAVDFLVKSMREDGSWPIDTNLATWGTTLSIRALDGSVSSPSALRSSLLSQQYREIHPFTNAAPGGWAWTDLPGGVPDADDTSSALVALKTLAAHDADLRHSSFVIRHCLPGITWLLDLQNRDGGIPTFCRGWGALPFDRSTPEITAHALLAWWTWHDDLPAPVQKRIVTATGRALAYLEASQREDGSWIPLWFGNEHTADESNPVYGTAQVINHLAGNTHLATLADWLIQSGLDYLRSAQKADGSYGGDADSPSSIEETAVAVQALCQDRSADALVRIQQATQWLFDATSHGTRFPSAPIGLYFARLWYHEQLYPVIWSLGAFQAARKVLVSEKH